MVWGEFNWAQGEEEFLKVIELNPNDALNRMYYAHLLMIVGRSEEAVVQGSLALKLDPLKPLMHWLYGNIMRWEGNEKLAIDHYNKALSIDPDFRFAKHALNDIRMRKAYNQGDFETWITSWDQKVEADGRWNKECRASVLNAFYEKGHLAAIEEMFKMNEKYGNGCYMSGAIKAERYIKLKNYDKAMDCLEESYENRDMFITYITTNKLLNDQLKDNPRYIELLQRMDLTYQ
jgi:tetratricopeptide (TPR) repeat protein